MKNSTIAPHRSLSRPGLSSDSLQRLPDSLRNVCESRRPYPRSIYRSLRTMLLVPGSSGFSQASPRRSPSCLLLLPLLLLSLSLHGQEQIRMAVPAPKGIVVFAGMALANGQTVDSYTIDRSYDNRQWEQLAELRSPQGWEPVRAAVDSWTPDFGFQGLPETADLRTRWQRCETAGVIDSMGYWAASTTLRLAAGIAWYDQTAAKEQRVWYRVRAIKNGSSVTEQFSLPVQHPFVPQYDPPVLDEKHVDKQLFYLRWQSTGDNPAPYFGIRYYEQGALKEAAGTTARYSIDATTFYVFQDSARTLRTERQYFLNPLDIYGNRGVATEFVLVSGRSADLPYFLKTRATADPKGLGIVLSWRLPQTDGLKALKIFRSDTFDGKEYTLAATLPPTDTTYTDRDIDPDRICYYYLETVSARQELPQQSNIFFSAGYDRLQPAYPAISRGRDLPNGVTIVVTSTEMHAAGVRIYRSDGFTSDLYPVTDILRLTGNTVAYTDTSSVLAGDRSFLYAATTVNSSSLESVLSDTLTVHPAIATTPPSPNRLTVVEEEGALHLVWEDVKTRHRATKGYRIFVRELPDGRFAPLLPADSLVTVPLYTDRGAQPGRVYEYAVQTVDDLGGRSASMVLASVAVKPVALPVPPGVWLQQQGGKVTVQWAETTLSRPLRVNLYRFQRGSQPQLLQSLRPEEQQVVDANVQKGELYFYFTTFSDGTRESARSPEAEIRVK